jgi:hypothetical protein
MDRDVENSVGPYQQLKVLHENSLNRVLVKLAKKYEVSMVRGIQTKCLQCGHDPGFHKCCPQCCVMANDPATISMVFGFRRMDPKDDFVVPQSRCFECR